MGLVAALIMVGAQEASAAHTWIQVDTGFTHTCAIRTDHTLWCWGTNDDGQLGLGTRDEGRVRPAQVGTDTDWASVSAGFDATCALKFSGTRWCMGWNGHGQLGVGDFTDRSLPTNVVWEPAFRSVSVGDAFACAISTQDRRFCWGSNDHTRLGWGTGPIPVSGVITTIGPQSQTPAPDQSSPVTFLESAYTWPSLSSAFDHSCGLTFGGTRACWGPGASGALGFGSTDDQPFAHSDSSETKWKSVSAGGSHSCGVTISFKAYCWGRGQAGQLGTGKVADEWTPVPAQSSRTWASVEAGDTHTCGLTTAWTRWCWGNNDHGQLGIGDTVGHSVPVTRSGEQTWSQLSLGLNYTCGITTTSFLYRWGANSFGQLGVGNNTDQNVPVRVDG